MKIYGSSTGRMPIQVNKIIVIVKFQNINFIIGQNWFLKMFLLFVIGKINKIIIDKIKAITPPNLLGIDRKIA